MGLFLMWYENKEEEKWVKIRTQMNVCVFTGFAVTYIYFRSRCTKLQTALLESVNVARQGLGDPEWAIAWKSGLCVTLIIILIFPETREVAVEKVVQIFLAIINDWLTQLRIIFE